MDEKLLKVAVIGCGNCGSMFAADASETLGIDAIAINGAERDLNLITSDKVIKFLTGDGKGTGKDRNKAKEFFFGDAGITMDKSFTEVIDKNDVILVTTSTGGGYGSGSSTELLEFLTTAYPNKVFIAVGVLPFADEQYAAFEGTKSWLKEMLKLEIGYVLYDNNRFASTLTPNKAAKKVNENFIHDVEVLQGDYIKPTFTGGIDERDLLTVLSVPGRLIIDSMVGLEPSHVKDGSIIKTIKNHIDKESAHAELVTDKKIMASATMYALGEQFDEFKNSVKSDLREVFGPHVKDTSNFSDNNEGTTAIVLSGLSAPVMTIDRIVNKSNELTKSINENKAATSKLFTEKDDENKAPTVVAKQSFANESGNDIGQKNSEELLKEFLARKRAK